MTDMSVAANRPLNWNLIAVNLSPRQMEAMEKRLAASDFARERGGRVLALTVPCAVQSRMSLETGFVFDMLNGWAKPMALPVDEKMALLADPDQRRELNDLAQGPGPIARHRQVAPAHHRRGVHRREQPEYQGRTIGEIAEAEGRETFDVLCDIVLADDLRTGLYQPVVGDDEATWQQAGRGVARRAHARRRHRRRRPPRPAGDVQRHHRHARHGACRRAEAAAVRGGDQLHHRRAGPAVRPEGARPPRHRLSRRRGRARPDDRRRPARSRSATTCPVARGASTARPTASTTCSSTAPRSSTTAGSPAPARVG